MHSVRKTSKGRLDLSAFTKADELKKKILFSLIALVIFRIGSYIPLPGIDSVALQEIASQNSGGILGMFNMLSGGSLGRMSVFALSIMPYITASIIIQLITVVSKRLEALKKEGELGRRKINQFTRYGTVILALFQGLGIAISLEAMSGSAGSVVLEPGMFFRATVVTTLVGGTVFLMWLGEQITVRGVGNGTSLIIFSGIVAGLPSAIAGTLELGRTGAISGLFILALLVIAILLVSVIVFMERSQRRVQVQYPKRQVGKKMLAGESSHIPLKVNTAGVIPPIFASSLLLFPTTAANLSQGVNSEILESLVFYLGHGKPLYIVLYVLLITFFAFFYTSVIFNPVETAENLKKYGGFIPGRRPGKNTAEYLDFVLTRITVVGALYISAVCVLPEILISHYSIPFYLGGTSILIVVNVVMDTTAQIQTHLFSHQYERLLKKSRIRKIV
jgi:preprotein translocase subunit SecY